MSKSLSGISLVSRRAKTRQPLEKVALNSYSVFIPASSSDQFIVIDFVDHNSFTLENGALWWQTAIPTANLGAGANAPTIQLGYVKKGEAISNANFVPMTDAIALGGTALTVREFSFNKTTANAPTNEPLAGVLLEGGVLVAKVAGDILDTSSDPYEGQTVLLRTRGYEGLNF